MHGRAESFLVKGVFSLLFIIYLYLLLSTYAHYLFRSQILTPNVNRHHKFVIKLYSDKRISVFK